MRREKFPRILTRVIGAIGAFFSFLIVLTLLLVDSKFISLLTDNVRYYNAKYVSEGVTLYEATIQRGELIGYDDVPTHSTDPDGKGYTFIGWDTTGDNIPDIIGNRIYRNFTANACYLELPWDKIDWSKIDWYQLLTILEDMDIDLESFLNYFGISLEDLEEMNVPIIRYKTSLPSGNAVYFRNQSFGDYNPKKSNWKDADYYSLSNISTNSINPLQYAADKISHCEYLGELMNTFDITYLKSGKKYHVPSYELTNYQNLASDSYSLAKPTGVDDEGHGTYSTTGNSYVPASPIIIQALKSLPFSSEIITKDELEYRNYVREHYLYVQDTYKDFFDEINREYNITFDGKNYNAIGLIDEYFASNGFEYKYDMASIPKNADPIIYFMEEGHEGIGRHFASAATLWYRSLGIPARYVQGAVDATEEGDEQEITLAQTLHAWVEIYVDGVGWLTADPAIKCVFGDQFDFLFGGASFDSDPYKEKQLVKVETEEEVIKWKLYDDFNTHSIELIATYDDDSTKKVYPTALTPTYIDTSYEHQQLVVATYVENGTAKSCAFVLDIVRPRLESLELDTSLVQREFELRQYFNYDGLRVYANYNIGEKTQLYDYQYSISTPDMSVLGEQEIYVGYGEYYYETGEYIYKEASYTIEIIEPRNIIPIELVIRDYPKELDVNVPIEEAKKYVKFDVYFSDGSIKNQDELESWNFRYTDFYPGSYLYGNYDYVGVEISYVRNSSPVYGYFYTYYVDYSRYKPEVNTTSLTKIYDGYGFYFDASLDGIFPYDTYSYSISKIRGSYPINDFADAINVGSWKFALTSKIFNMNEQDITDLYTNFTTKESTIGISIKQRPITITSVSSDYIYFNGVPVFGESYFASFDIGGYGLADGDYIASATFTYEIDGAGTYTNSFDPSSIVILNKNGQDVTKCYDITAVEGTIIVVG